MAITPVAFVTGTKITTALVLTELERVRNWVNATMLVGDIADGDLNETHIYRPETYGFPKQNSEAQTQEIYGDVKAQVDPSTAPDGLTPAIVVSTGSRLPIAKLRGRSSIFPQFLLDNDQFIVPHMSRRVVLDATSEVEVAAVWEATTQYDKDFNPTYPDTGGAFRLVHRALGSGVVTLIPGTTRRINVHLVLSGTVGHAGNTTYSTGGVVTLSAGKYDIYLQYLRNGADDEVEQVIIGARSIVVEVHKT